MNQNSKDWTNTHIHILVIRLIFLENSMTEKYYTAKPAKFANTEKCNLTKVDDLPEYANGNSIPVKVDKDSAIQRLSTNIYAHATSGVREIYANEARACNIAKKLGYDPEILFTVNETYRRIILEGIDSMGMSWDTFKHVYCVLGRTTNNDGTQPGQFGFGRTAYTVMSSVMILETNCRETNDKYRVDGINGVEFITGQPTPKMDHYGTRISIVVKPDVDLKDLVKMVISCARLSGIKTTIIADGSLEGHSGVVEQQSLADMIKEEETDQVKKRIDKNTIIVTENKNVAIAYIAGRLSKKSYFFLCGMPISFEYAGRYKQVIQRMAVNVKDERNFLPTDDREKFTNVATKAITEEIDSLIDVEIKKLGKIKSFKEYISNDRSRLFDRFRHCGGVDILTKLLGRDSFDLLCTYSNILYTQAADASYFRDHLCCIITGPNFLITNSLNNDTISAIREHDPTIMVVWLEKYDAMRRIFSQHGILTVKEYIKANNIKIKKQQALGMSRFPD